MELLNRDAVVARLRKNLDDLYIMFMPPSDMALKRHAFLTNPLVVIASAEHRLAGRSRLKLSALARKRFIMREAGSGTRLACDAHFKAHGFESQVRLALGSNEAIKELMAEGMGLAVMSRRALNAQATSAIISISTQAPMGIWAAPKALRAWAPT